MHNLVRSLAFFCIAFTLVNISALTAPQRYNLQKTSPALLAASNKGIEALLPKEDIRTFRLLNRLPKEIKGGELFKRHFTTQELVKLYDDLSAIKQNLDETTGSNIYDVSDLLDPQGNFKGNNILAAIQDFAARKLAKKINCTFDSMEDGSCQPFINSTDPSLTPEERARKPFEEITEPWTKNWIKVLNDYEKYENYYETCIQEHKEYLNNSPSPYPGTAQNLEGYIRKLQTLPINILKNIHQLQEAYSFQEEIQNAIQKTIDGMFPEKTLLNFRRSGEKIDDAGSLWLYYENLDFQLSTDNTMIDFKRSNRDTPVRLILNFSKYPDKIVMRDTAAHPIAQLLDRGAHDLTLNIKTAFEIAISISKYLHAQSLIILTLDNQKTNDILMQLGFKCRAKLNATQKLVLDLTKKKERSCAIL